MNTKTIYVLDLILDENNIHHRYHFTSKPVRADLIKVITRQKSNVSHNYHLIHDTLQSMLDMAAVINFNIHSNNLYAWGTTQLNPEKSKVAGRLNYSEEPMFDNSKGANLAT